MSKTEGLHEDLARGASVRQGSDRSFAIVFAAVFGVLGILPIIGGGSPRIWGFAVAGVFLAVGLVAPSMLAPLNRAWSRLGLLLHKVTNPIIMGVLFFGAITPMAIIMRMMGRDALGLGLDHQTDSYWIPRKPPGPKPSSMTHQY